jgi:hypothetical protein
VHVLSLDLIYNIFCSDNLYVFNLNDAIFGLLIFERQTYNKNFFIKSDTDFKSWIEFNLHVDKSKLFGLSRHSKS